MAASEKNALSTVAIVIALILALVAVVAGFWFMAPFVLAVALVVIITQARRTPTPGP